MFSLGLLSGCLPKVLVSRTEPSKFPTALLLVSALTHRTSKYGSFRTSLAPRIWKFLTGSDEMSFGGTKQWGDVWTEAVWKARIYKLGGRRS